MQFTLTYTGDLRANARPNHKHQIRKVFHSQLRSLWDQQPLVDYKEWYDGTSADKKFSLNRNVGSFRFVPLISPDLYLCCELDINMLRPEPPGTIITQAGDIDNRLKTLFDALRYPQNEGELPSDEKPGEDQDPFFCLLEDDMLITSVSVKTDRLLTPVESNAEVQLMIQVRTQLTRMLIGNKLARGFALP